MTATFRLFAVPRFRPQFRAAVQPTFPFATCHDRARAVEQELQSLLFSLEIAGVHVSFREEVAEMLDDIHQLRMSLPT